MPFNGNSVNEIFCWSISFIDLIKLGDQGQPIPLTLTLVPKRVNPMNIEALNMKYGRNKKMKHYRPTQQQFHTLKNWSIIIIIQLLSNPEATC